MEPLAVSKTGMEMLAPLPGPLSSERRTETLNGCMDRLPALSPMLPPYTPPRCSLLSRSSRSPVARLP
eukprot:8302785-Pyramimonas_sp.AAC.1